MGDTGKYGRCALTNRWVLRDTMVGATLKVYRPDGSEHRIRIRLSEEGMADLVGRLQPLDWTNDLRTADELTESGETFEPRSAGDET